MSIPNILLETALNNILLCGYIDRTQIYATDTHVDDVIDTLKLSAQNIPSAMLTSLILAPNSPMVSLGLAILFARADDEFLSSTDTKDKCAIVLENFDAEKMIEFIDYLRCKIFGRGFGSRPQKLVKNIVEDWSLNQIIEMSKSQDYLIYNLVKLVHPRFSDQKGRAIKKIIDKMK
jgi:hypothetical protein